jgi:hypothetical protein
MTTASEAGDDWRTEDTYCYKAADDQQLSEAVVRAVAAMSNRSPVGARSDGEPAPLDPLYRVVDPDALDALFRDAGDESRPGVIEFGYCGYEVTVESTGVVTVTER